MGGFSEVDVCRNGPPAFLWPDSEMRRKVGTLLKSIDVCRNRTPGLSLTRLRNAPESGVSASVEPLDHGTCWLVHIFLPIMPYIPTDSATLPQLVCPLNIADVRHNIPTRSGTSEQRYSYPHKQYSDALEALRYRNAHVVSIIKRTTKPLCSRHDWISDTVSGVSIKRSYPRKSIPPTI